VSDGRVRIHKALADAGVASRRKAEELVSAGRVHVNGEPAHIGQLVDPGSDRLQVDGRPVGGSGEQKRIYLALAKPAGVTSTVSDRHAERTVIDLIPRDLRQDATRLYPVGRLDRDSEGLLLLTNDGAWAQRMLHPTHGVEREYAVGVRYRLNDDQRHHLERGIDYEEGRATIARLSDATRADARMLEGLIGRGARDLVWYRATLEQGMKRQLRRMFGSVGSPVRRLVRLRFGTVRLSGMSLGDVRQISAQERRQLDSLAHGDRASREGAGARQGGAEAGRRRGLVVSVDGPGGSGKSSVGAGAAMKLRYRFCDTGVLYRGLTWLAQAHGTDLDEPSALVELIPLMELAPDENERYVKIIVHGRDVTEDLHTAEVDRDVSRVSQHAAVRAQLLPIQHALAAPGRIVMAGRDIGTIVLPDADLKIYLDVSVEERARRRATERGVEDDAQAVAQIEDELRKRDGVDSTRTTAPLRVPEGALQINTDGNTLEETVDEVVDAVRRRERDKRA
jgi:23S rRNA pseudouridine2605 synthase